MGNSFFCMMMERKRFRQITYSISLNYKSSRPAHQSSKILHWWSWYGIKKMSQNPEVISSTQPNVNITVTEQLFKLWYPWPNTPHKRDQLGWSFGWKQRERPKIVKDYTNLWPTTHTRGLLCLMKSWTGRSKNVTSDNFFTSLHLAN